MVTVGVTVGVTVLVGVGVGVGAGQGFDDEHVSQSGSPLTAGYTGFVESQTIVGVVTVCVIAWTA